MTIRAGRQGGKILSLNETTLLRLKATSGALERGGGSQGGARPEVRGRPLNKVSIPPPKKFLHVVLGMMRLKE